MKTNKAGLELIEEFEGFFPKAYQTYLGKDAQGVPKYDVPTIGYGHTTAAGLPKVYMGMVITKDQADQILQTDLAAVEKQVQDAVKVPVNENQFSALVSFTFNEGIGRDDTPGYGLRGSTLLHRLNKGDYDVGNEFLKWTKAQGIVLEGLVRRRTAEKALWESQVSEHPHQEAPKQEETKPDFHDTPKLPEESPAQSGFLLLIQFLKAVFLAIFGVKK